MEEVFGAGAAVLNDDRLARALDAIAPELDRITGSVGAAAIAAFGVDVARLHWDMTSISLYGAFTEAEEGYPAPSWGHAKTGAPISSRSRPGSQSPEMAGSRCSTGPSAAARVRCPRSWAR